MNSYNNTFFICTFLFFGLYKKFFTIIFFLKNVKIIVRIIFFVHFIIAKKVSYNVHIKKRVLKRIIKIYYKNVFIK